MDSMEHSGTIPTTTIHTEPYIFAEGWQLNKENPGYPLDPGIIIEKNVRVKMRDGCELSANVYRPDTQTKCPVLLSFTMYHKDLSGWAEGRSLHSDQVSRECAFEAIDPGFWVRHGYIVILFDERGHGLSAGERLGSREGEDYYDGIEWAATQPWCNGNVGMSGVSALANCQWYAASAQPPHLKAICVWEGFGAESAVGGLGPRFWGITEYGFGRQMVWWVAPLNPAMGQSLPSTSPKPKIILENIKVPALICVSHDQELHAMGSMWGYEHIKSEYKWFYSHGGLKWQKYYSAEALSFQKMFFDCFLKDSRNSGILQTTRVRLEVRDTRDKYYVRYENEWPIERTQYKKLYLDASNNRLCSDKPNREGKITYDSAEGAAVFSIKFEEETEITGNMGAYLWVSPDDVDDMDIMVKLRKLDTDGNVVYFDHCHSVGRYEVASGWWRLSWRELDKNKSRPEWPIPSYRTQQKVKPGEIVQAIFNIYFSSTLFHKGETLQMFIAGSNRYGVVSNRFAYEFLNYGKHSIYTGGNYDSYLLIPILPPLSPDEINP